MGSNAAFVSRRFCALLTEFGSYATAYATLFRQTVLPQKKIFCLSIEGEGTLESLKRQARRQEMFAADVAPTFVLG